MKKFPRCDLPMRKFPRFVVYPIEYWIDEALDVPLGPKVTLRFHGENIDRMETPHKCWRWGSFHGLHKTAYGAAQSVKGFYRYQKKMWG
jgi:hypothetical protein